MPLESHWAELLFLGGCPLKPAFSTGSFCTDLLRILLILATCDRANLEESRMITSTLIQNFDDRWQVFRRRHTAPYEDLRVMRSLS